MALVKANMSAAIKTEIEALYGAADDDAKLQDFCDAIAKGIIDNLKEDADIKPGTFKDGTSSAVTGLGKID